MADPRARPRIVLKPGVVVRHPIHGTGYVHGALLGLAAGDAPGQWTDDTSMALCLGESLVRCRRFEPKDVSIPGG
jgi:ADP-ribosylglycohydrolase